jgi:hypothetical protein
MAKMINRKPKNEIIGPKVMRRKLKISGLNLIWVEEPVIRKKPMTITIKPAAIRNRLIFPIPEE